MAFYTPFQHFIVNTLKKGPSSISPPENNVEAVQLRELLENGIIKVSESGVYYLTYKGE